MKIEDLIISSEDCAFLLLLKKYKTLTALCEEMKMDKGFCSRKLSRISALAPVLEKSQGKWCLSAQGLALTNWYEETIQQQHTILNSKHNLKIATTPMISERKLTPVLLRVKDKLKLNNITVTTTQHDTEQKLLTSKIDFALVCGIPYSPEIRYKRIFKYPLVIAIPASWKIKFSNYTELMIKYPYVYHLDLNIRTLLEVDSHVPAPVLEFDNLLGLRKAVIDGFGWSIFPLYSISSEIQMKKLKVLTEIKREEEFQLWWVQGRPTKESINTLIECLTK